MIALLRTPQPKPTESLMGYIIRVAEANGYDSPWQVLTAAEIEQRGMVSAGFPVEQLAELLGTNPDALNSIAYTRTHEDGSREFKLLSHSLGSGLRTEPLRLARHALCPDCVTERGFIDAFFDLRMAVACPIHRRALVSRCPNCDSPLTLFRPGLLTCSCGTSLANCEPVPVSPEVVSLMAILKAKVEESWPDGDLNGLPVAHLMSTQLRMLLAHLPSFARFNRPEAGIDMAVIMEGAAAALTDWPNGFHELLRQIDATQPTHIVAFQKRFKALWGLFFNVPATRAAFSWLHDEFLRYGREFASTSIIHPRMLRGVEADRRFISLKEWASRVGVMAGTARSWAERGLIPAHRIETDTGPRYVVDGAAIAPPLEADGGEVLDARSAAAYVGMPVSVLASLKASGHMSCQHRLKIKGGYHTADLDAFLRRLIGLSPLSADTSRDDVVSLSHALSNYKMHSDAQKARVVVAYLEGSLRSCGRTGETTDDILFNRADLMAFVVEGRAISAEGALSLRDAAARIGCDPTAMSGLLAGGWLETVEARESPRISEASVERFAKSYIALSELAKELTSSSRRLMLLCKKSGIPVLPISRETGSIAPFVERKHIDAVKQLARENPTRDEVATARAEAGHPAVEAFRRYLDNLKACGEQLPMRGGKPNKVAIARACGFARDVLYDNACAVELLNAHVEGAEKEHDSSDV